MFDHEWQEYDEQPAPLLKVRDINSVNFQFTEEFENWIEPDNLDAEEKLLRQIERVIDR